MPDPFSGDPLLAEWKRIYPELQRDGSPDCPPVESLFALVLEELGEQERLRLADHVVACLRCSGLFKQLCRLHDAVREELPRDDLP